MERVGLKVVRKPEAEESKSTEKLQFVDLGCCHHQSCKVNLSGSGLSIIRYILVNLPKEGEFRTYICELGHTHRLSFSGCLDQKGEPE